MQYTQFLDKIIEMCDELDDEGVTSDKLLAEVTAEAHARLKEMKAKLKAEQTPVVRQPRKRPRGKNNG